MGKRIENNDDPLYNEKYPLKWENQLQGRTAMSNQVAIVIPAYEPDDRFLALLQELDAAGLGPIYVVDDGSGPAYADLFAAAEPLIQKSQGVLLHHETNRGKGRALKTAFSYLLEQAPELIGAVTADSDGQHTVDCIKKVIAALQAHPDCLVLGVRKFDTEDVPWKSRCGNRLTAKVFGYLTGVPVSDTQTGLRGIPRDYMSELLYLKGERFEFEMRMLLDATEHCRIVEVPIKTVYDSKEHHQTHFHPFRDSFRIYRIIGERFFRYVFSSLSSCVLDLLLFWLLSGLLKPCLPLFYAAVATAAARVLSASYNYLLNYKLVFHSRQRITASALKYCLLAVVQMLCSAALVTALVWLLPACPAVLLKAVVDTLLFFISYRIQQRLVF